MREYNNMAEFNEWKFFLENDGRLNNYLWGLIILPFIYLFVTKTHYTFDRFWNEQTWLKLVNKYNIFDIRIFLFLNLVESDESRECGNNVAELSIKDFSFKIGESPVKKDFQGRER